MAEQMSVCFSGRSQAALGLSLSVGFLLIFFSPCCHKISANWIGGSVHVYSFSGFD